MFKDETNLTRSFAKTKTKKLRFGIVQARFNEPITTVIWQDCRQELIKQGVAAKHISHYIVPGALEIPFALVGLAESYSYDALIAIGCVIRGETYHFELVANKSADAINQLALEYAVPVINSILTTENEQQALARAKTKGIINAHDAIEMALLAKQLKQQNAS